MEHALCVLDNNVYTHTLRIFNTYFLQRATMVTWKPFNIRLSVYWFSGPRPWYSLLHNSQRLWEQTGLPCRCTIKSWGKHVVRHHRRICHPVGSQNPLFLHCAVIQIGRSLVRFQLVSLEFFIDIKSFRSHYVPGVDSVSNRSECQEHFLG